MRIKKILKKKGGTLKPMPNAKITKEVREYRAAFKRGEKILAEREKNLKK